MKKVTRLFRVLALFTALLFTTGLWAQTTLLSEGFNGTAIPAGWTQTIQSGSTSWAFGVVGGYSSQPATTHSGAYNARLYFAGYGQKTLLISPSMNFASNPFGTLTFWHAQAYWGGDQDSLTVLYRTSTTGPWIKLAAYNSNLTAWTLETISLPNVNGTYQIAFRGCAEYGYGVCLDDVQVDALAAPPPPPPIVITLGTGSTTSSGYPYYTYYMDNRTQMLYLASELIAGGASSGRITTFGLNVASTSSQAMNGFNIRMAHTPLTSITTWQTPVWTTVYSSASQPAPATGWENITLTTPFIYNGTDNLLVEICFDNTSWTSSKSVYCTSTANKTVYYYMDNGTGCSLTSAYTTSYRPNMRITFVPMIGQITGTVKDNYSLLPINAANVAISTLNLPTNGSGVYGPSNVGVGTYQATASKTGYLPKTKTAIITENQVTTVDFNLDPVPATISGIVTNAATGAPVVGAKIRFGTTPTSPTTYSVAGGVYTLNVYPGGSAILDVTKPGFEPFQVPSFTVTPPNTYTQNIALLEALNPPLDVVATLNAAQTAVDITWGLPVGDYMLIYDDGIPENFAIWATAGNKNAVKFTPLAYPVTLKGGRINIGIIDNYPSGANPLKTFKVAVYDASGPGGTPGAELVAPFDVTPTAYGWVEFNITNTTITSGSFYIAMIQGGTPPNAAGLAVDTTTQQLRSYSQFGTGPWIPASGNFMIRAVVNGSGGPLLAANAPAGNTVTATAVPNLIYQNTPATVTGTEGIARIEYIGDNPESITGYQVWRLKEGEQGNQALWTTIGTPTTTNYTDPSWPSLPCGPYLWAVKAQYTNNRWSAPAFSNIIGKCWTAQVTVNLTLSCDSVTPENATLTLQNLDYPQYVYTETSGPSGVVVFDSVWKGNYKLTIQLWAFQTQVIGAPPAAPIVVMGDITLNPVLLQVKTPPTGLSVDDRTLWATWHPPLYQIPLLVETWASGNFTANQWVVAGGTNWSVTTGVGNPQPSAQFYYSPTVTNYSQTITSKDLVGQFSPVLHLDYDIYLNNFGTTTVEQMAVELWDGTTWHLLKNYDNQGGDIPWTSESLDIAAYTDITFKIRFRAYGEDSYNIDNWNVDNIKIIAMGETQGPDPCLIGYNFYLNNVLSAFIPPTDTSYWIPPSQAIYGQTYNACVLAIYGSGYSTTSCDVFTSHWLYPPTNLQGEQIESSVYLTWEKPVVSDEYPDNMGDNVPQMRTSFPNPSVDYSPYVSNRVITESPDAIWDVLFSWPVIPATGAGAGQVGTEIKNGFIYTSVWGGANAGPPWFSKYNQNGTLVEAFNITGATAVRDLACDGTYFYGAPASSSVYKMDFDAHTLISTITAPGAVRHIAWDPAADNNNGGFWCGDWSTMRLMKMDGTLIFNGPAMSSAYGSAYDNASAGGPYLWVHSQEGTPLMTLTQYKINPTSLTPTGLTHIVGTSVPGITNAAMAGGLSSGVVNNKFALIGMSQDAPNVCFALEISSNVPQQGGTPAGLVGYNVYRDETLIHFVPDPDTLFYYDLNVDPNEYCYDVTAKYDLTPYGFPGQFDESLPAFSGPVCLNVQYGYPIPWFEPWDNGTFSFNQWTVSGGNWSVNTGFGNPAPTADFSWQPIVHTYEQSITTPTLSAAAWTCADLWLDFDIKLIDRNSTGDEILTVEVYANGDWTEKAEFTNTASMDWTPQHIDIHTLMGKAFKVRFRAHGENSDDILHWYVDNIHVYGVCKPPIDLDATQSHFETTLTWGAPECPNPQTMMEFIFDDGGWENGWRYNPGFLGWFGTYFDIDPTLNGVLVNMKVYFVDNGSGSAMNLGLDIFDNAQQLVNGVTFNANVFDTWIDVPVPNIPFDGPFYGMVKWDMVSGNSYYLADDEDGPNVGLGYQYDGTTWTVSSPACVFFVRATAMVNGELKEIFISNGHAQVAPSAPISNANSINRSGDSGDHSETSILDVADSSTFVGYNVWRTDETGAGPFALLTPSPITATTYLDTYPSTLLAGTFKYYVTSIFEDSQNPTPPVLCESPSDTITVPFPPVGINDLNGNSISLYPNPATEFVNVVATSELKTVEVLNFLGQTVITKNNINAKSMKLNVSSLQSGVYFVKVNAAAGSKTTKITVTR